ncbi:MAG: type IV pili methyl-accepting chemotaxis transducer N-terminal domain-containing protein [Archangium sp.]|nr:type IV pili methyl-accepting chemotaxis transducer N-terminal domain-containing protein [Archangium sp.]
MSSIALLSIGGSLVIRDSVERQRSAAEVIDVAGRQRMLSQRLALMLREWQAASGEPRAQLEVAIEQELARITLSQRWLDTGPGSIEPGALAGVLGPVHAHLTAYTSAITRARAGDFAASDEASALARGPLLGALEAQVLAHSDAARAQVASSLVLERALLCAVLVLLLVEALALFRPLNRRLSSTLASLETAVAELSAQRTHLQRLVIASGDGWVLLGPGGQLLSQPSPQVLSWFPGCITGGFFETLFGPEDAARAIARLGEAPVGLPAYVERGVSAWEVRYQVQSRAPLEVVAVVRDVSAVRALYATAQQRDAAEARARLTTAERLASLGTLAAGIAHEINNPASWIRTNTDYVAARLSEHPVPDCEDLLETLSQTREGADRICKIVEDMRRISRGGDGGPSALDVREALERILRLARGELQRKAVIDVDLGPVPLVAATDVELGQVFLNLLNNAVQAMPPDRAVEACRVRLRTRTDAQGRAVVEVEDNGSGISAEVGKKLFTPFFTTKGPGVGTGLGLSICHAIVERRGGELDFRSTVGEGTVFRVTFPPASAELSGAQPGPRVSPPSPDSGGSARARLRPRRPTSGPLHR